MYEKITALICQQLDIDEADISPDTEFITDLGCDSLDIVELTITLEEEFGMPEVPEEDLKAIKSIGDLVSYAEAHI